MILDMVNGKANLETQVDLKKDNAFLQNIPVKTCIMKEMWQLYDHFI